MSEQTEERTSPTSLPPLSEKELEDRIAVRRKEMNEQPCYRCDHSLAQPNVECVCCRNAHTPNQDGDFDAG